MLQLLKKVPLFSGMSDDILHHLTLLAGIKKYFPGEYLCRKGEFGDELFIIKQGTVKISLPASEDNEIILDILKEGDFLGELALIDGDVRSADAIARDETEVIILSRECFRKLLQENHRIKDVLISVLTARLRAANESLMDNFLPLLTKVTKLTAEQERLESELRIAREIQMGILPPPRPHPALSVLDFYAYLKPAREVGGDLFHYFFIDDDHLCFAIGDVSDKGVPAAFFMAMTMTLLKNTAMSGGRIGEIVTRLNDELCQNNPNNMFVTLFTGILNLKTGILEYVNAGHNPVLYMSTSGYCFLEKISGPVIGAIEGLQYKTFCMHLDNSDVLFLYTDGVTEAMNLEKKLYGKDRLVEIVSENARYVVAHELIQLVCDDIKQFIGSAMQSDDITMMALRWHGMGCIRQ